MSGYQVLARKYRPRRFGELVGQDVAVQTLRNALAAQQIAHAYLFSGLRGVGKTTVARILAKALNCEKGPTPEPCGECVPCTEIALGSALDVLEIDAASNTGIDDVRELRDIVRNLPIRDRYRVIILDEAHQLSKAAFNGLLKILEEPPAHVVFILASTEKDKFPATILSRCLQVDFRPIPADLIAARLGEVAAEEPLALTAGAAQLIARASEGSLRDALSLLDRVRAFAAGTVDEDAVAAVVGLPPFETVLTLWSAIERGDVASALAVVREEDRIGRDAVALYEQVVQLLSALLLLASAPEAPSALPAAHRETLRASAGKLGVPMLLRLLALALDGKSLVATAERPALAVTVAVGRLALWPRLQRVESLLAGAPPAAPVERKEPVVPEPAVPTSRDATAGEPASQLAAALEADGAHLLAGRVRSVREIVVEGDRLLLRCTGVPAATVRSLREAQGQLAEAAARAGLPAAVEVVEGGPGPAAREDTLRARVEADESVRRVLEVFGGRIERVEEKP